MVKVTSPYTVICGLVGADVRPGALDHVFNSVQGQLKSDWIISPLLLLISSSPEANVCVKWMYSILMNI